ncbi:permease prefix domain 1-containing protein [Dactylosporangium sp. NPDC048998]|uniref:permease prefix domain 1-containing protein n=1 Tax=Dactylosporangium sp. NPDC048998 TaxID=3363976 RepID=UPI003710D228
MNAAQPTASAEARRTAYLAEIAAGLRGPRRRRASILDELRDGLEQAIADHTAAGLPPDRAVTAAIEQFGSPAAIADAFAPELATSYARRALAWFIATGPLVGIWWLLLLQPHAWRTGPAGLLAAIPVVPLVAFAVVAAGATLATTGRLIRWIPEAGPRQAVTATTAVAALALTTDTAVIGVWAWSATAVPPLAVVAAAASLTRIACSVITVRHTTAIRHCITPTPDGRTTVRHRDAGV